MKDWLEQFWHQYILGHGMVRHNEWTPNVMGKPWMCSCGKEWK
jgi:hypothetical protein